MWRRLSSWRAREIRDVGTRADPEKMALVGETLRAGYGAQDGEDALDDRLVALMLELSVEPIEAAEQPVRLKIQGRRR